ncbi:MAG: hypothetical protein J7545_15650 [Roseofilum sp. SBFL]|uniref:hypothetical protein n=1 Tax=Roseofilum sp. SBFL TaxID=2821496 RepID=UPI001B2955C9|nr:hypothetical protein [Roseofilum sp. SBFL]MBP0043382.1 hypothetical protein [Roseofilum sp. SBFL]
MPTPQPRPKGQPTSKGTSRTGGYKTPAPFRRRSEGRGNPFAPIGEAYLSGVETIGEWMGEQFDKIDIPRPKIPKPWTTPEQWVKDIESIGEGYPEEEKGEGEEEEKPPQMGDSSNLDWGDSGQTIGGVTRGSEAPTFPPEYDIPQPEGIWIPPIPKESTPGVDMLNGKAGIYIGVNVNACKGNSYSTPSFPDGANMFFYFLVRDGEHLNDGWPQDSTGRPKVWFKGKQHWQGYINLASRLLSEKLGWWFGSSANSFYSPVRATYRLMEDGTWHGPDYINGSMSHAESGFNYYFQIYTEFIPPPTYYSPLPKSKGRDMNCCNQTLANQNRIIKDLKMIKKWVGADYDQIEMPKHPFMDTNVGWLEEIFGGGTTKLGSLPDLIVYFIQAVDTMFGDEFPMKIKVPPHIVEGAKTSGESIPEEFEMVTPGEAIKAIVEMVINLQDDEGNAKSIMMKCLLESYKAREEAYKARNMLDQFVKWSGIETEEVKNFLQAEFTLPETDNDPNNSIKWDEWKEKYPDPDEELKAFLEPSKMAVKAHFFDPEKGRDLIDDLYLVRNIYQIVRAAHTISVGKHRDGIKQKLTDYLIDFGAKYAYHAVTAPAEREKRGIGEDEDDDNYDPKGLKDFRKFRKVVEDGLVPPNESPASGTSVSDRGREKPYGRHLEETAEIRDITDK